jgi:hypothetical protein
MFRTTHRPSSGAQKIVIAASDFTYVYGCRLPLWWLSHRSGNRQPKTYVKPDAAITVFELLMMGGVSSETCWAIKKHWNNKFYYTVATCWFFLWDLYYDAWIHIYCRYGLGIETRWGRFSAPVQTGPEAHPASYTMGTWSFPGAKRPERGVDHPPHLAPKSKEEYSYTSTPPLGLRGLSRVNITFTFTFIFNVYLVKDLWAG